MNEFVARNGLIALDSSSISGPFVVTGSILATSGITTSGNIGLGYSLTLNGSYLGATTALTLTAGGSDATITQTGNNSLILTNPLGMYTFKKTAQTDFFVINQHNGLTYTTGNFGIGTTSPTTKLDVRGNTFLSGSVTGSDMLIRGSGNTSATTALTVQNSDLTQIFYVQNDGILRSLNGFLTIDGSSQLNLLPLSTNGNFNGLSISRTQTPTSGERNGIRIATSLTPTSGTADSNQILIIPTINQTGGANGITRGLYVQPTLTTAADWRSIQWDNNTGWGLYGAGSANNFLAGSLSIGSTSLTGINLRVSKNITGATIAYGQYIDSVVQSDVTNTAYGIRTFLTTQAASFTVTNLIHYAATQTTQGSGSTIGTQVGFDVGPFNNGNSNIAYRGNINSGVNSWNLYMAGTANNYLAGNLGVGVVNPTNTLDVIGNFKVTPVPGSLLQIGSSTNTSSFQEGGAILVDDRTVTIGSWDNSRFNVGTKYNHVNNSEALDSIEFIVGATTTTNGRAMFISSSGNVGIGTTSPEARLDVRGNTFISGSVGIGTFPFSGATSPLSSSLEVGVGSLIVNGFCSISKISPGGYGAIGSNYYLDSSGNLRRKNADMVSIIDMPTAGFRWLSAGVGAANSIISTTQLMVLNNAGNLGINTTSPTYRLDVNGSFRATGSITATAGSDYFDIAHDITQPATTGSQVYEVNITPTFRYAAPNQTQTALRVAATFSGSAALSSSQSNIIADFGSTSAGSQLIVNDVTSGSIYMVNDVSGLPIIEANSNWDVFIYDYPNVVLRKTGSQIDITGKLKVSGSFVLPLSQSTSPEIGSAYWSGSFLFIYDGTQYRSASFS